MKLVKRSELNRRVARTLKANWSIELGVDLKAIHGVDLEAELTNQLVNEIIAGKNK